MGLGFARLNVELNFPCPYPKMVFFGLGAKEIISDLDMEVINIFGNLQWLKVYEERKLFMLLLVGALHCLGKYFFML